MVKISATHHKTKDGTIKRNPASKLLASKSDFESYVRVQREGRFNMLDPNARMLSGLSREKYFDIIHNYGKYMQKYPSV